MPKMKTEVENFYISYSDMVTLLLIFFVYLFSLAEINPVKFLEAQNAIQTEMKTPPNSDALKRIDIEKEKLQEMGKKIQKFIKDNHLEAKVSVHYDYKGMKLDLNLGDTVLFELGKANVKPDAQAILTKLAEYFKDSTSKIIVEGHTDDIPIHTSQFPSNWELSSARAASVVHFIEEQNIESSRFMVIGYNQFSPLAPNNSEENRSKNRRVKITLQPDIEKIIKASSKK